MPRTIKQFFEMDTATRAEESSSLATRIATLKKYPHPTVSQKRELDELLSEFDAATSADGLYRVSRGENVEGFKLERAFDDEPSTRDDEPSGSRWTGMKTYPMFGGNVRDDAAHILDQSVRSNILPAYAAEKVERLIADGSEVAQSVAAKWAAVTGAPAYRTAFAKLCKDPQRGHMAWTNDEADAYRRVEAFESEERAMSLTGSAGGFMVPLTLDPSIIITNDGTTNPIRRISRNVTTSTNAWQGVTSSGASAEWKAEAAQAADGSPTVDDAPIPVHFLDVFVPFSYEIGMDATDFLGELTKVMNDAVDRTEAVAFTTGTGSGQPKGIVTALDGTSSEVAPTVAESLTAADVYKVQNALPPRWQPNAQWAAALATLNTLDQFETTNGAKKFPELANDRLLRHPVHEISDMDSTYNPAATADNFLMLYGDWSQFIVVDRIGTRMELIQTLFGANQRPTGQRGAFLYKRTGSDCVVPGAFRMLNVATTA